jgi:polyhydroxybutyrate depolymerase
VAWSELASHLRLAITAGALLAGGCVVIDGDLFDAGTRDPRPGQEPVDDSAGDPSGEVDAGAESDATVDAGGQSPLEPSAGCGKRGAKTGTFDKKITSGGKSRTFTLTVPGAYDPAVPYRVVVGFHGRDWNGAKMRPYLNLERYSDGQVIFVYPWAERNGAYIGWQLGPYASRFGGNEDLVFFDDMLADLANEYCIDPSRVFVTGQSWGGDMTHLVACLRGDRVRAAIGVAANGTYYLPPKPGNCVGKPDVFTLHGVDDTDIPFSQGQALRDFWYREHGCSAQTDRIQPDQCVEARGCTARTVWCPYGPGNGGHQIPNYYSQTAMRWFLAY